LDEHSEQVFLLAEVLQDYFSFHIETTKIKEIYFFHSEQATKMNIDCEGLIKEQLKQLFANQEEHMFLLSSPTPSPRHSISLHSQQDEDFKFDKTDNCISFSYMKTSVKIYVGDISKSTTDCIINPTTKTLELNGAVSKCLLKVDKTLDEQLKKLRNNFDGLCLTKSNDTGFNAVCHLDVRSGQLGQTILKCLNQLNVTQKTNGQNIGGVTFPFIGTGANYITPEKSAELMIKAIYEYLTQTKSENNHLKIINICVYKDQKDYLNCFEAEMEFFKNDKQGNLIIFQENLR
jgi:O-acetyl-ADP-ribose deacetylase (regulator of RNase III)